MVVSFVQGLRTPIDSIRDYTNRLLSEQSGTLVDDQRRSLRRVGAYVERMERLLDDLLETTVADIPLQA